MLRIHPIVLVFLVCIGCQNLDEVFLLGSGWEMKVGSHPGDASTEGWKQVNVPGNYHRRDDLSDYSGWITLRVALPSGALKLRSDGRLLAFYAGFPGGPRRIFIDGVEFYALDDPNRPQSLHRHSLVMIPPSVLKPDSRFLEVALHGSPARPFLHWSESRVPVQIGASENVTHNFFTVQAAEIGFIVVYLVVGCLHLFFFSQRPIDTHNAFFGLFACATGVFWYTVIPPEFIPMKYDYLRHQIQHASLFAVGPLFIAFLDKLIIGRIARVTQLFGIVSVILAGLTLVIHDWLWQARILECWEYIGLPMGFYAAGSTLLYAWRGSTDAQRMIPSVILLVAIALHDMLKQQGLVNTPVLGRYSLLIVILGSTTILTGRFLRLHLHVQDLNQELIRMNHDLIEADLAREKARWDQERLRADLHDALGAKLLDLRHLAVAAARQLGPDGIAQELMGAADAAGRILREELVHQEDIRLMREDFVKGVRLILLRRYARVERPFLFEAADQFAEGFKNAITGWTDVLYPILQELASNDLKYGTGPARWRLDRAGQSLIVELKTMSTYSDTQREQGFGTQTLQSRLSRIGGTLIIQPHAPEFYVRVELPAESV